MLMQTDYMFAELKFVHSFKMIILPRAGLKTEYFSNLEIWFGMLMDLR